MSQNLRLGLCLSLVLISCAEAPVAPGNYKKTISGDQGSQNGEATPATETGSTPAGETEYKSPAESGMSPAPKDGLASTDSSIKTPAPVVVPTQTKSEATLSLIASNKAFQIKTQDLGLCMDRSNGDIVLRECNPTNRNQGALLTKGSDDYYEISLGEDKRCLDLFNGNTAENAGLLALDCNKGNNQKWQLKVDEKGLFTIRSKAALDKCLNFKIRSDGTRYSLINTCDPANMGQVFNAVDPKGIDAGISMLAVQSTNWCIDTEKSKFSDARPLQQRPCRGGDDQMFALLKGANGGVQIAIGDRCVSYLRVGVKDKVFTMGISLDSCANALNWKQTVSADLITTFESIEEPGKCLEMDTELTKNRAMLQLGKCSSEPTQKFKKIAADANFVPDLNRPVITLEEQCTRKVFVADVSVNGDGKWVDEQLSKIEGSTVKFNMKRTRDVCKSLYRKASELRDDHRFEFVVFRDGDMGAVAYVTGGQFVQQTHINSPFARNADNGSRTMRLFFIDLLGHEATHTIQNGMKFDEFPIAFGENIATINSFISGGDVDADFNRDKSGSEWWKGADRIEPFFVYIDKKSPDFVYKLNMDLVNVMPAKWTSARIEVLTGKKVEQWWAEYQADPKCTAHTVHCLP